MKRKLLYILPVLDPLTPTHYFHILELLSEISRELDVFLLVERSPLPTLNGYTQKFSFPPLSLLERLAVIIYCRLRGYRDVYVHYSYFGALLARLTGARVFYWHCEVYQNFSLAKDFLLFLTLKCVNYLVTGTAAIGDYYSQTFDLPKNRVKILPNWINLQRFKVSRSRSQLRRELNLPVDQNIVLFAHRLSSRKGADLLPEIIARTTSVLPKTFFVIAGGGGGNLRNNLETEFKKNNYVSHVRLIPEVPNEQIPSLMAACDVLIMPSRQEGFPHILLEAMASNLPFVATKVGGLEEILTAVQKKYLVPPENSSDFSTKLIHLLKNKSLRKVLTLSGEKQVRKYDLVHVSRLFIALFK